MKSRIAAAFERPLENRVRPSNEPVQRSKDPQPIGEILQELFAQYQRRFPAITVSVVETPATVI